MRARAEIPRRQQELPPTAGLPARLADWRPGPARLAASLAAQLGLGLAQVLLTCSGSAALMLALAALQRRQPRRQRVLVPAYTCPLVALAIHQAGLQCVPVDVRAGHFDFDPQALRNACDERTLAVMPTHLAGRVADVDDAVAVAHAAGAFVIEDAAQALGARAKGQSVGLQGDVGFFSLAVGKGLTTYEGGVLISRDAGLQAEMAALLTRLLPANRRWELRRTLELAAYTVFYRPWGLRLAYGAPLRRALKKGRIVQAVGDDFSLPLPTHRLGRWRQAVGARAAARWPDFLSACTARAQHYLPRLQAIDGVQVLNDAPGQAGTWPFFMLLLPDEARRNAALERLWSSGYGVSRLFIHALSDYADLQALLAPADAARHARDLAARSLSIGNSAWLQAADMDVICHQLQMSCR